MSLVSIWKGNKDDFAKKRLQQIISIAGDGRLSDDGPATQELREFLRIVPSEMLISYSDECLESPFESSGFALQDIVNEIGERLGFEITRGRYRGKRGENGFDGLWKLTSSHHIIVEVKTTDAYAINLDTIAAYRKGILAAAEPSSAHPSFLLVVGRQDTGGLEAQIRGSRYAWDMRIISVDALTRLLRLREALDDPKTVDQISDILVPQEFTRLDRIINVVFSTAEEAALSEEVENIDDSVEKETSRFGDKKTPKFHPLAFHEECIERAERALNANFVKESRSIYTDKEKNTRLWVAVSKQHGDNEKNIFWFAFHPHQRQALEGAKSSFALLGCGDYSMLFLIPYDFLKQYIDSMWTTTRDERMYWHVKVEGICDKYILLLKKGSKNPDISQFFLSSEKGR